MRGGRGSGPGRRNIGQVWLSLKKCGDSGENRCSRRCSMRRSWRLRHRAGSAHGPGRWAGPARNRELRLRNIEKRRPASKPEQCQAASGKRFGRHRELRGCFPTPSSTPS